MGFPFTQKELREIERNIHRGAKLLKARREAQARYNQRVNFSEKKPAVIILFSKR